jgi:hypothetical protein
MEIVTRVRCDERSSALLQSRPASARYYRIAVLGAGFGMGSPLAIAVAFRGVARWWPGLPGWRQDLHDAVAMARNSDPATLGVVVTRTYSPAITYGVLRADDSALRTIEEAVQTAQSAVTD